MPSRQNNYREQSMCDWFKRCRPQINYSTSLILYSSSRPNKAIDTVVLFRLVLMLFD